MSTTAAAIGKPAKPRIPGGKIGYNRRIEQPGIAASYETLVVEDSRASMQIITHHLERMGITPVPAATGTEAVDLFLSERPDMVLLDIVLPDIDGFEVARRLRQTEQPGTGRRSSSSPR